MGTRGRWAADRTTDRYDVSGRPTDGGGLTAIALIRRRAHGEQHAHTPTQHTPPHLHQSMHLPQRLETTACTQGRIMVRWKDASVLHLFSDIEAP